MKNTIDALALKKAFIAGANNLDNKKDYINELNVFPVPDGDTGKYDNDDHVSKKGS